MSVNETLLAASKLLFDGETVAVVRGKRITETPVGFEIAGEYLPTVAEASKLARVIAIGETVRDVFDEIATDVPVIIGADDSCIRLVDCLPAE